MQGLGRCGLGRFFVRFFCVFISFFLLLLFVVVVGIWFVGHHRGGAHRLGASGGGCRNDAALMGTGGGGLDLSSKYCRNREIMPTGGWTRSAITLSLTRAHEEEVELSSSSSSSSDSHIQFFLGTTTYNPISPQTNHTFLLLN